MVARTDINGNKLCPVGGTSNPCEPFQLIKTADNALYDSIIAESLLIGGAPLNIYKLLGVTARNTPQDVTGFGKAISSPFIPGFPPTKVFEAHGSFRSAARGSAVTEQAYVGYDFGQVALRDGSHRNNVGSYANRVVTQLVLNQSICVEWTASKLRVERSDDGVKWYGVAIINDVSPGSGAYNFSAFNAARFWRVRPTEFRGAATNDFWEVTQAYFGESGIADINTIEDKVFFENRNREYLTTPLPIKGLFQHQDTMLEVMLQGMSLNQQLILEVSFSQCVAVLGRPPVIGDIIEMPSEAMYDQNLNAIKKFVEVMDVAWSSTSYTPGWMPTLLRLSVQPAIASRETKDIFGSSFQHQFDPTGLFTDMAGVPGSDVQDYIPITEAIRQEARAEVPFRGIDQSNTGQPTLEEQQRVSAEVGYAAVAPFIKPQKGFYVEDGLPPNNEPYTESPTYPSSPKDGDYHRMTYVGVANDIPARLYRYHAVSARWVFLETDKRSLFNPISPMLLPPTQK